MYIYLYMLMDNYGHIRTHMHTYGYMWGHMGAQEPWSGPKLAAGSHGTLAIAMGP